MYPHHSSSSSSSSSQPITQSGLTRYGSAPSSLLNTTVDAVLGGSRLLPPSAGPHYYSDKDHNIRSSPSPSPSSYDTFLAGSASSSSLLRQKSSPAGFLSHAHNLNTTGFTITRGLKSELSFTAQGQDCLSRISENNLVDASTSYAAAATQPSPSWGEDGDIVFSKRSKTNNNDSDFLNSLTALDSQFSLPQTTLEMAAVENLLHIPQDSVPCKIRAKRGCATHPRSIAERERRTRISGKLKKLQDLVPNMDKQTSYADMLDLAVQHIKGLQGQVQKLHNELENCTCGCKQST